MRMLGTAAIGLLAMTGMAEASSVITLGAAGSTPSVVRVGALDPAKGASTPSVIALGEPAVTDEKVAAIPEKSAHGRTPTPMIIRGGVVGGAFATPAATAAAKPTAPAATAPANDAAATPPNGTAAAAPNSDSKAVGNKPAATATASNGQEQPQVQPKNNPTLPRPSKAM
jgi:hypothetical protein